MILPIFFKPIPIIRGNTEALTFQDGYSPAQIKVEWVLFEQWPIWGVI